MQRCLLLQLTALLASGALAAQAQPGDSGGSLKFRVFTPTGGPIALADSATYQVGFGDAPGATLAGLHRLRSTSLPTSTNYRQGHYYYYKGFFYLEPPEGYYGAPVTERFRLYVAHGADTMFVYPPSIRFNQLHLDSIPYRPGSYRLTDFIYEAAESARPLGLRISPGPLTDWSALHKPVPVVYLEQVADFGIRFTPQWYRYFYSRDTIIDGKRYPTRGSLEHPRGLSPGGLHRLTAGPPTYFERYNPKLLRQSGQPGVFQLYEIVEALDSTHFFPPARQASTEHGYAVETEETRWRRYGRAASFELDTVFYQQGAYYAWGTRQFPSPIDSAVLKPRYVKFRLWPADELRPGQLACLRRNYLAQLAEAQAHPTGPAKPVMSQTNCD